MYLFEIFHVSLYICHSEKSNRVEYQILVVESPMRISNKFSLVESPVQDSTSRILNSANLDILPFW